MYLNIAFPFTVFICNTDPNTLILIINSIGYPRLRIKKKS